MKSILLALTLLTISTSLSYSKTLLKSGSKSYVYFSNKKIVHLKLEDVSIKFDPNCKGRFCLWNVTKMKNIYTPTIFNTNRDWIKYINYDLGLGMTFDVDTRKIFFRSLSSHSIWSLPIYDSTYLDKGISVQQSTTDWVKKGVKKIEKQDPSTKSWDGFTLTNPGKYIEIKGDKDVRISDLDVFIAVFGREFLGIYNSAEFLDGKNQSTNAAQTTFYVGNLVLKQNNVTGKSGETGVYFYYSNGSLGAIEIRSRVCMCATRIYVGDYNEGLRILN